MMSGQQKPVSLGFGGAAYSLTRNAMSDEIDDSEYEIPTRLNEVLNAFSEAAQQAIENIKMLQAITYDLEEVLTESPSRDIDEDILEYLESMKESLWESLELIREAERLAWSLNAPTVLGDPRWFPSIVGLRAYQPKFQI